MPGAPRWHLGACWNLGCGGEDGSARFAHSGERHARPLWLAPRDPWPQSWRWHGHVAWLALAQQRSLSGLKGLSLSLSLARARARARALSDHDNDVFYICSFRTKNRLLQDGQSLCLLPLPSPAMLDGSAVCFLIFRVIPPPPPPPPPPPHSSFLTGRPRCPPGSVAFVLKTLSSQPPTPLGRFRNTLGGPAAFLMQFRNKAGMWVLAPQSSF